MSGEQVEEVVIRQFGEGGAELGMTRSEILEHLDQLAVLFQSNIGGSIEFLFAWLVAMFFIAHRLSKPQFLIANGFYLIICTLQYVSLLSISQAEDTWSRYGGFYTQVLDTIGDHSLLDRIMEAAASGYFLSLVYWAVVVVSIWWAASCRKNQPKDIGSPI